MIPDSFGSSGCISERSRGRSGKGVCALAETDVYMAGLTLKRRHAD